MDDRTCANFGDDRPSDLWDYGEKKERRKKEDLNYSSKTECPTSGRSFVDNNAFGYASGSYRRSVLIYTGRYENSRVK